MAEVEQYLFIFHSWELQRLWLKVASNFLYRKKANFPNLEKINNPIVWNYSDAPELFHEFLDSLAIPPRSQSPKPANKWRVLIIDICLQYSWRNPEEETPTYSSIDRKKLWDTRNTSFCSSGVAHSYIPDLLLPPVFIVTVLLSPQQATCKIASVNLRQVWQGCQAVFSHTSAMVAVDRVFRDSINYAFGGWVEHIEMEIL